MLFRIMLQGLFSDANPSIPAFPAARGRLI
jgi:hypothetical protein